MANIEVKVLIDNNSLNDNFESEHGLSMLINYKNTNILLDFGLTNNIFNNAKVLDVNLEDVNLAVVSHAHYDHTGGLGQFMQKNKTCKVYARQGIDGIYYSTRPLSSVKQKDDIVKKAYLLRPIGVSADNLKQINRINIIDEITEIAKGIHLLCDPSQSKLENDTLFMKENDKIAPDTFMHELILVIEDDDSVHVFTGCCHRGVMPTLDYVSSKFSKPIRTLVGGLHLVSRGKSGINEKAAQSAVDAINKYNVQNICVGHCTKDAGYEYLKKAYSQTRQFSSGYEFSI